MCKYFFNLINKTLKKKDNVVLYSPKSVFLNHDHWTLPKDGIKGDLALWKACNRYLHFEEM